MLIHLLKGGNGLFTASSGITSTLGKTETSFSKALASFLSASKAYTLPAFSANFLVSVPKPAPISKTLSLLVISAKIICLSNIEKSMRNFYPRALRR